MYRKLCCAALYIVFVGQKRDIFIHAVAARQALDQENPLNRALNHSLLSEKQTGLPPCPRHQYVCTCALVLRVVYTYDAGLMAIG